MKHRMSPVLAWLLAVGVATGSSVVAIKVYADFIGIHGEVHCKICAAMPGASVGV